ncbi:GNAT family N-acetyltransferase [Aestuariivita sp.]|jgi:RimJ/RimL family protein N-acetyltransferase|uniref:GNAT family N-acetyltransferase n=1 Tax=Aestuariivita sp. TaxID=1872407 RepID=UPI0025BCEC33|nr:GNAT family N-acetyltransferase [Aestuariivita sp.]
MMAPYTPPEQTSPDERAARMRAMIPQIQTPRLTLRAPKLDDLPTLTAFYRTERSHLVGGPLDARAASRVMAGTIGQWALRGYGMWYIAGRATDEVLGWTGILFAPGWAEPELGWTVFPEAEGKGLAFEAALAARDYAAAHLGIHRPISYIEPVNTRSIALAERLGAVRESTGALLGKPCLIYRHPALDDDGSVEAYA